MWWLLVSLISVMLSCRSLPCMGEKMCTWALFLVIVLWWTFWYLRRHQWLLEGGLRNSSIDAPSQYLGHVQHVVMLIGRDRQYGKRQQQQPRKAGSRRRGLSDLEKRHEYLFHVKVRKNHSTIKSVAWCRKKWVLYLVAQPFKEWKRCSCSPEVCFKWSSSFGWWRSQPPCSFAALLPCVYMLSAQRGKLTLPSNASACDTRGRKITACLSNEGGRFKQNHNLRGLLYFLYCGKHQAPKRNERKIHFCPQRSCSLNRQVNKRWESKGMPGEVKQWPKVTEPGQG